MTKTYRKKPCLHIIPIIVVVALSVITYLNCLPNQFVYDDTSTIVDNKLIKDWGNFPILFTHDYFKLSGELTYRPIVTLSYFIDYFLWHMNPMGYHLVNVVLHTINAILVYFLVLLLFRQYNKTQESHDQISNVGLALLTCMLFTVHPIVSEVVNMVSYREDLTATSFLIASFLFFLLYKERIIAQASFRPLLEGADLKGFSLPTFSSKSTISLYAGALATYFFALLSKESAIVLPALIFFFELLFTKRFFASGKTALKIIRAPFFLGYIGISIGYLIIRFLILHNPTEKIVYPEGSFFVNILTMTKVLGRYIASIFLPFNLNADYHVLYLKTPLILSFLIPFFLVISIAVIALRCWKKFIKTFPNVNGNEGFYRVIIFAILWFFISILPVMNIIPLANIMADRYLYLPILGFCLFISATVAYLRTAIKYPVIISLIIFYIFITVTRNNVWRDEFKLWYKSSQSPLCSFTTYNNLGTQYNKKGYPDTALKCYQKALQKAQEVGFTQYATVYYNAGNAYEKKNMPNEAATAYKKAVQLKSDYQQAHNNLGKVYFTLGQYDDALAEYNNALKIDPDFPYAYNNMGVLYNKLGRQDDAVVAYKKALSLDPKYSDAYYNLGNIYEARMQYDLAIEAYQNAIKYDPAQVYVHNNLGTIFDKKGFWEEAIAEYKHAIRLDPKYPYSYNNLGASLTKKGDMDGALAEFQKAVNLFPNQPDFHFNLGYTYLQKGDLNNALKEFETTLKIAPLHTEALFSIGNIYYRQGQTEKAAKSWQAVLKINPNHIRAKKCLEMIDK
ncbi:MAG TPA: tetratricopeptide repeat protein [Candidatus Wunengus sp. YC60]|uniref:tetratricopeptide repeat protein n=1 Tax=Candidatus Wunengus sp. YC60 TaxID=3367697 RepID=UPI004024C95D